MCQGASGKRGTCSGKAAACEEEGQAGPLHCEKVLVSCIELSSSRGMQVRHSFHCYLILVCLAFAFEAYSWFSFWPYCL